jgi:MbtH protein
MAADAWEEDDRTFMVVVNDEEQYSIWPLDRELPPGWRSVGETGAKQVCLDYIDRVWTDMRPLSLRRALADAQADKH